MSAVIYGFDPVLLSPIISSIPLSLLSNGLIATEDFIATDGQSVFSLATDIVVGVLIDVFRNGSLLREGSGYDYQVNYVDNTITFNNALVLDTWIRFSVKVPLIDYDYVVAISAGGNSKFDCSGLTSNSSIDVFVNGKLKREGSSYDYTRDIPNSKIVFNYVLVLDSWVRLRIRSN